MAPWGLLPLRWRFTDGQPMARAEAHMGGGGGALGSPPPQVAPTGIPAAAACSRAARRTSRASFTASGMNGSGAPGWGCWRSRSSHSCACRFLRQESDSHLCYNGRFSHA